MNVMNKLESKFKYPIGFSDHTVDNLSSIVACSMGATIIEKHVTLDKNLPGPDHQASSTIDEFIDLIKLIRKIEIIRGSVNKSFSKNENEISRSARKSIVSKREIKFGSVIKNEDICYKRPGTGFLPIYREKVINKIASKNIPKNVIITKDLLNND